MEGETDEGKHAADDGSPVENAGVVAGVPVGPEGDAAQAVTPVLDPARTAHGHFCASQM